MIQIFAIISARIIEAKRDAEIFQHPIEPRSLEWHLLKFLQYGLWIIAGYDCTSWNILIGVILAWPVFELSLKLFRKWNE